MHELRNFLITILSILVAGCICLFLYSLLVIASIENEQIVIVAIEKTEKIIQVIVFSFVMLLLVFGHRPNLTSVKHRSIKRWKKNK